MKIVLRSLIYLILILSILALGVFLRLQKLVQSKEAEGLLVQYLEVISDSHVDYEDFNISYFPTPRAYFKGADFKFNQHDLQLFAGDLDLKLSVPYLLLGKARIAGIRVGAASIEGVLPGGSDKDRFHLENVLLKTGTIKPGKPTEIFFESDAGNVEKVVRFTGQVLNIDSHFYEMGFELNGNISSYVFPAQIEPFFNQLRIHTGTMNGNFIVQKEPEEYALNFISEGTVKGVVLEVLDGGEWQFAPALSGPYSFDVLWDEPQKHLTVNKAVLNTDLGAFEMSGALGFETKSFEAFHLSAKTISLEALPQYAPKLFEALPLYIGFSGYCDLAASVQGDAKKLNIFTDWNFESALLTYGKYFNKSKSEAFRVSLNVAVEDLKEVTGDFTVDFQEMKMKGTLKDVDLESGNVNVNLITNKFALNPVAIAVPVLSDFELGGSGKILANWSTNYRDFQSAEDVTFNLSVTDGSLKFSNGAEITDLSFIMDSGELALEIQNASLMIDSSPLNMDLTIYNLETSPKVRGQLNSDALNVNQAYGIYKNLMSGLSDVQPVAKIEAFLKEFVEGVFPEGQSVGGFKSHFIYEDRKLNIESLSIEDFYSGRIAARGELDAVQAVPYYWFEIHGSDIDLNAWETRGELQEARIQGDLSFKSFFQGVIPENDERLIQDLLHGNGKTVIKQGSFKNLDVLDVISKIGHFQNLNLGGGVHSIYDQIEFDWNLSEGRFLAENFVAENQGLVVRGNGSLGFDSLINFRLDAYLSEVVAGHLFPGINSFSNDFTQLRIGPVPLLLSGTLDQPNLKSDPVQLPDLIQKIQSGHMSDILYQVYYE